ncbi:MAG: zinc ribbon domain-containing protein, partial [Nocardiaceae bacterium]|nr:zinc ribbon domain-containing protein [Nocardiaceae bacterium]
RRPGPPTVKRHWLTGILKCSQCADGMGRVAGFQRSQGARPDKHGYRCVRCLKVSISKHDVDELIRGVIVARLARPDAAELLIDRNAPNLDALADEAKTIRVGLDDAATMFADGTITASQLRTATERLRARLSATEARMAHASRTRVFGGIPLGTDQVADAFDNLDPDRQRAIVDALLTATIMPANQRGGRHAFNPERVRIEWKA